MNHLAAHKATRYFLIATPFLLEFRRIQTSKTQTLHIGIMNITCPVQLCTGGPEEPVSRWQMGRGGIQHSLYNNLWLHSQCLVPRILEVPGGHLWAIRTPLAGTVSTEGSTPASVSLEATLDPVSTLVQSS